MPIDEILARLAISRGRRIHVVPLDFGDLPVEGTWVRAHGGDVIFYDQHLDLAGRDRIVREQLEMLLREPVEITDANQPPLRELIERAITARPSPALAARILGATVERPDVAAPEQMSAAVLPMQGNRAS